MACVQVGAQEGLENRGGHRGQHQVGTVYKVVQYIVAIPMVPTGMYGELLQQY